MLLKFATMLKDSPNIGTGTVTMKRDPRVLPFGRILRKTKVNELPQLLNILFGQMSLIGPRPLTKQTFGSYPKATQDVISAVSPGLSGIGSIVFRGEEEIMAGANASVDFYENVIAPLYLTKISFCTSKQYSLRFGLLYFQNQHFLGVYLKGFLNHLIN